MWDYMQIIECMKSSHTTSASHVMQTSLTGSEAGEREEFFKTRSNCFAVGFSTNSA